MVSILEDLKHVYIQITAQSLNQPLEKKELLSELTA